jgi:hypothetical protein
MIKSTLRNQRVKKRCPVSLPVSIEELSETPINEKKARKGSTADVSNSGLGIYSHVELKPGTILEIECNDIWEEPKKFAVKWCNKVRLNFYRIGFKLRTKVNQNLLYLIQNRLRQFYKTDSLLHFAVAGLLLSYSILRRLYPLNPGTRLFKQTQQPARKCMYPFGIATFQFHYPLFHSFKGIRKGLALAA